MLVIPLDVTCVSIASDGLSETSKSLTQMRLDIDLQCERDGSLAGDSIGSVGSTAPVMIRPPSDRGDVAANLFSVRELWTPGTAVRLLRRRLLERYEKRTLDLPLSKFDWWRPYGVWHLDSNLQMVSTDPVNEAISRRISNHRKIFDESWEIASSMAVLYFPGIVIRRDNYEDYMVHQEQAQRHHIVAIETGVILDQILGSDFEQWLAPIYLLKQDGVGATYEVDIPWCISEFLKMIVEIDLFNDKGGAWSLINMQHIMNRFSIAQEEIALRGLLLLNFRKDNNALKGRLNKEIAAVLESVGSESHTDVDPAQVFSNTAMVYLIETYISHFDHLKANWPSNPGRVYEPSPTLKRWESGLEASKDCCLGNYAFRHVTALRLCQLRPQLNILFVVKTEGFLDINRARLAKHLSEEYSATIVDDSMPSKAPRLWGEDYEWVLLWLFVVCERPKDDPECSTMEEPRPEERAHLLAGIWDRVLELNDLLVADAIRERHVETLT